MIASRHPRSLRLLLLCGAAAYLVLNSLDSLWSISTDLAHHYALVARLSELWTLPYTGDFSLGEMNSYPRSSHILAAVIGRVLGSALLGLQVSTLLSIVVLWASLVSMVLSVPKRAGFIAAALLATLLWLNRRYLHLELHGDEVIENFFFAQLVGQALVVSVVALVLHCERTGVNPRLRYALLAAAVYVATGVHLLPALELLCFFIALVGIDVYRQLSRGKFNWRADSVGVVLALTASAALLLHPSFSAMSDLSKNNGGITARYVQSMGGFLAYGAVHLLCSLFILRRWLALREGEPARQWLALKYLGLFGLAVAGVCILQLAALQLGHGSEYSVKKHIFALNTILLIELTVLAALLICRRAPNWLTDSRGAAGAASTDLLAPLCLVMAVWCVTPARAQLDTSNLVALEHQLQLQRDLSMPDIPGKFNYVASIDGLPSSLAYMMSIGVLRSPRVAAPQMSMPAWWIADWGQVATLVTSANNDLDQDASCRRGAPVNALVMLDGACLEKRFSGPASVGRRRTALPG